MKKWPLRWQRLRLRVQEFLSPLRKPFGEAIRGALLIRMGSFGKWLGIRRLRFWRMAVFGFGTD